MFTMAMTTFRLIKSEMTTTNCEDRNNLDDNDDKTTNCKDRNNLDDDDNDNNHLDLEPRIGENFLFKKLGKPEVCVDIIHSVFSYRFCFYFLNNLSPIIISWPAIYEYFLCNHCSVHLQWFLTYSWRPHT